MAKNSENYSVNDRIHHSVFGLGTISQTDSRYTTIAFDESGTRKFLTDMVRFERSDTPAPAKPASTKTAGRKKGKRKT